MKRSFLLLGTLMATAALTQAQSIPSSDSLASVHKIHEVIDYNMHMLDEPEPFFNWRKSSGGGWMCARLVPIVFHCLSGLELNNMSTKYKF